MHWFNVSASTFPAAAVAQLFLELFAIGWRARARRECRVSASDPACPVSCKTASLPRGRPRGRDAVLQLTGQAGSLAETLHSRRALARQPIANSSRNSWATAAAGNVDAETLNQCIERSLQQLNAQQSLALIVDRRPMGWTSVSQRNRFRCETEVHPMGRLSTISARLC